MSERLCSEVPSLGGAISCVSLSVTLLRRANTAERIDVLLGGGDA